MNRRRWYYKNGTCFEEFDILFDNGRFMLVQNVKTKVFSFGVCENFGTLYGFPVNWSCLTKDQAIERLNNMIRIDMQWKVKADGLFANDKTRLDRIDAGQRVEQQGILALLDHGLDGNNVAQMEKAKIALQEHLINR